MDQLLPLQFGYKYLSEPCVTYHHEHASVNDLSIAVPEVARYHLW